MHKGHAHTNTHTYIYIHVYVLYEWKSIFHTQERRLSILNTYDLCSFRYLALNLRVIAVVQVANKY